MFGNKIVRKIIISVGLTITASQGMDVHFGGDDRDPSRDRNFANYNLGQHTPDSKRVRDEEKEAPGAPEKKRQRREYENAPEDEAWMGNVSRRLFVDEDDQGNDENDLGVFLYVDSETVEDEATQSDEEDSVGPGDYNFDNSDDEDMNLNTLSFPAA